MCIIIHEFYSLVYYSSILFNVMIVNLDLKLNFFILYEWTNTDSVLEIISAN